MGISVKDIANGRKTFFVTPDISLIPESYLEDFFALGYECYFVENDKRIPLEKKLDIIISVFHDVILFFNVDYIIPGISWPDFIKRIVEKYDNKTSIGVMYVKRQSKDDRARLEQKYIYDMGLNCGCIQLEYQKRHNFDIIEKILYANQAQGKRRNIRALCTNACTFSFMINDDPCTGTLQDISLSHFSFVVPKDKVELKLYERIKDFHLSLRGVLFRSDAVLIMKRVFGDQILYVFAFISPNGTGGLGPRSKQMLVPNIYRLMSLNCNNLLNQMYNKSCEEGHVTQIDEIEDAVQSQY